MTRKADVTIREQYFCLLKFMKSPEESDIGLTDDDINSDRMRIEPTQNCMENVPPVSAQFQESVATAMARNERNSEPAPITQASPSEANEDVNCSTASLSVRRESLNARGKNCGSITVSYGPLPYSDIFIVQMLL